MEEANLGSFPNMSSGNVYKNVKPEHIAKLKEEHQKGLVLCLQKIEQWEKFKKDYEVLKKRLETLPDRISHDVMVPFGSLAFMPGQLIHTNEIMTLLGANWFAEVSAKHAAEISQRRIRQCVKMLEDLKKEKEQFENWLSYIHEITGGDLVGLGSYWSEEELQQWREQHSENVKAYGQKNQISSSPSEEVCQDIVQEITEIPDKDYFQILDDLGKKESLFDEFNDIPSEVDDGDENEDEDLDDSSESDEKEKGDEEDSSDEHSKNNEKHVKWKDQEGEKMKNCITFTHTSRKSKSHSNTKPMAISKTKSKTKESGPLSPVKIQSPSDIYKCFSTKPEQPKPKSILKRTTSLDDTDTSVEPISESAPMKNIEDMPVLKTRFKEQTAFTGEIIEHEMDKESLNEKLEDTIQRPPSRFKAQRQNKKS